MKHSYRVKMYGQYSYFSHLSAATAAMKNYNYGKCTLEIKLGGEWIAERAVWQ